MKEYKGDPSCHLALQKALQVTKEDPSYGKAWLSLGGARGNMQQYDLAVTAFEKALDLGLTARFVQPAQENLQMARVGAGIPDPLLEATELAALTVGLR